jgi:hypothetical protein
VSNPGPTPDEFDDEDLIRSEFDSIVSGLSLDESAPTTYLDEIEKFEDVNRFIAPNPPRQNVKQIFRTAILAIKKWFNRGYHEDDGVVL